MLKVQVGKGATDYLSVIDNKLDYERSKVRITRSKDSLTINVEAEDPRALLASLNGALKQLRVVSSVDTGLSEI